MYVFASFVLLFRGFHFFVFDILQAELMLFGVMSLLMGHWIFIVAKICVKSSLLSSKFFPCALESDLHSVEHVLVSSSNYLNKSVSKMQVKAGSHDYCPEVSLLAHV